MTVYRHRASGPGPAGDIWIVTMHSSGSATLSSAHAAWQAAVNSFITSGLGPHWPTAQQVTGLQTDQLDPSTGKNVAQATSAVTYKGTGGGAAIDQRSSVVTGLRTTVPTRAGRGRMYWPPVQDTDLTATGLIASAVATSVASSLASALTTMATTSVPVIYHRPTRTTTTITAVTVGQVLGTQRRRTNKVAPSYASASV